MRSVLKAAALASALLILGASQAFAQAPQLLSDSSVTENSPKPDTQAPLRNSPGSAAKPECCKKSLSASAWDTLSQDILSDRESRRSAALAALAAVGPREDIIPLLKGALQDKHSLVRKNAAAALGELQVHSAAPELRQLLDDPSPEVSFAAASALWKMGDHTGRNLLIATLSGVRKGDGIIKSEMKTTVERYRDPKQLAIMGAREAAGTFLGPASMGIGVAEALMKDRGAQARAQCATLLAKDPTPDAVHQLSLALNDKNWAVRAAAAQSLAKSPAQVSPELFEPLLIDDSRAVRDMAAAGIIRTARAPRPSDLHWPVPASSEPPTEQAEKH